MKPICSPSLETAIADLRNVRTQDLIDIVGKVNKLAKKPAAGSWFTHLNYLWKDAAVSILLTARRDCRVVFNYVNPDGAVAMTIAMPARRVDVHAYPWHLSAKAEAVVRRNSESLSVASRLLAEQLAAALAA